MTWARVVLVHGFVADGHLNWVRPGIAAALVERGRRVVVVDLRGHGRSEKPHDLEAYEDRALARDVVGLADQLGVDGYDLVGYSLGSIVAASVTLLDARVRSLVLGGIGDRLMDASWDRPKQLVAGLLGDSSAASVDPSIECRRDRGRASRPGPRRPRDCGDPAGVPRCGRLSRPGGTTSRRIFELTPRGHDESDSGYGAADVLSTRVSTDF